MDNKIKKILDDLYKIDYSLKNHEEDLINLINKLIYLKPNIKIDDYFVDSLKKKLILNKKNTNFNLNNFTIMNKFFYVASGAILTAILIIPSIYVLNNKNIIPSNISFVKKNKKELVNLQVNDLEKNNAFGSLLSSNSDNLKINKTMEKSISSQSFSSFDAKDSVSGAGLGSGNATYDSKMIMPPPYELINYNYIYEGDDLAEIAEKNKVYKKIAKSIDFKIDQIDLKQNLINAANINNAKVRHLNFSEDKDFGYSFNLDYINNSVSINTNWEKWPDPYKDCFDDACYEKNKLKESDILDNAKVIQLATDFLNYYGINLDNYGEAQIDSNYLKRFEDADDFVPENLTVIFPLVIDDKIVHSENGNPNGIQVSVSNRHKKVQSAYGIYFNNFESSEYANITDQEKIINFAKNGGLYGQYKHPEAKKEIDLKLGTPKMTLINYWRYNKGTKNGEELLVPALIFPIIEKPEDIHFYKNNIVVPLNKEIFEERNKENKDQKIIEPMPLLR